MPRIQNQRLFQAVYDAARARFAGAAALGPFVEPMAAGTPLYRYVSYRNALPQVAEAGRTVWGRLEADTENRWTGSDGRGGGRRGLYLSEEFLDLARPFPELDHYMRPDHTSGQVYYYEYAPGQAPRMELADADALRSMFLFSARAESRGVDLRLTRDGVDHPLLGDILEVARRAAPDAFGGVGGLRELYTHASDASFCRAVGNALFDATDHTWFRTTSVRDGVSTNLIRRAPGGPDGPIVVDGLDPQGRATFMLREGGGVEGVTTMLDLQYNAMLEPDDPVGQGVLPREVQVAQLSDIASQMVDNLARNYGEMIAVTPPSDALEEVARGIAALRGHVEARDLAEIVAQIRSLQDTIAAQHDAAPHVRQALSLVDGAVDGLGDITAAIERAQAPPLGPDEAQGLDVDGPDPEQYDPDFEDHPNPDHSE
jgi:hypothetical protein